MPHYKRVLSASAMLLLGACANEGPIAPSDTRLNKGAKTGTGGSEPAMAYSIAFALNDHGVVVGTAHDFSGANRRAVRWRVDVDGTVHGPENLGTLDGAPISEAVAVNRAGLIAGYAEHSPSERRAFVHDGSLRPLALPAGAIRSWALGISDAGAVVGSADFDLGGETVSRALVWLMPLDAAAGPLQLPPLAGHAGSSARWVNDGGVVGGWSHGPDASVPVRWQLHPDGSASGPIPIGEIHVYAMNGEPAFAGVRNDLGTFLRGGIYTVLPPLSRHANSWARGQGNPGFGGDVRVVGVSGMGSGGERAVAWWVSASGAASDPLDLGVPDPYVRAAAAAIDSNGRVAGHGYETFYERQAILWLPENGGYRSILLGSLAGGTGGSKPCKGHKCQ
jgi:hypothetical protein